MGSNPGLRSEKCLLLGRCYVCQICRRMLKVIGHRGDEGDLISRVRRELKIEDTLAMRESDKFLPPSNVKQ